MINISKKVTLAMKGFLEVGTVNLFEGSGNETKMNIFMANINSREFDYLNLEEHLTEVVADFILTRKTKQKYVEDEDYMKLSKVARDKFKKHTENKGEFGELILYTLLEGHLKAPKILSKMSLKTSKDMYVHGADAIHLLTIPEKNRYHIIYGESKMFQNITDAFRNAFDSISRFTDYQKTGAKFFENSLISSQIDENILDENDRKIIEGIVYPTKNTSSYKVSDAFGIFIGFEITITEDEKALSEDDFEKWICETIINNIKNKQTTIEKQIIGKNLRGQNFYVYIMPFTNINETRKTMIERMTK